MPIKDISKTVIAYGLLPPKEDDLLPQFPPSEWFSWVDDAIKKEMEKIEMNDIQKFIKLLRKNVKNKSGYIDKQDMDTIILDTLEEMNDKE